MLTGKNIYPKTSKKNGTSRRGCQQKQASFGFNNISAQTHKGWEIKTKSVKKAL